MVLFGERFALKNNHNLEISTDSTWLYFKERVKSRRFKSDKRKNVFAIPLCLFERQYEIFFVEGREMLLFRYHATSCCHLNFISLCFLFDV